jgi:hypothetical protein
MDSGALYLMIHLSNSVRATTMADLCGIAATSQNFVNPSIITMTYLSPLLVVFNGPNKINVQSLVCPIAYL